MALRRKVIPQSVATAKAMLEQRLRGTEVIEAPNYLRWAQDEVYIEDPHKVGNSVIDFQPWKMQLEYMECIHQHKQTITLKARQLGVSWCVIVYCVWLAVFHQNVQILVFSKDLEAAKAAGIGSAILKRLELTDKKIAQMADGVRQRRVVEVGG